MSYDSAKKKCQIVGTRPVKTEHRFSLLENSKAARHEVAKSFFYKCIYIISTHMCCTTGTCVVQLAVTLKNVFYDFYHMSSAQRAMGFSRQIKLNIKKIVLLK